jgi:hypothetical protein
MLHWTPAPLVAHSGAGSPVALPGIRLAASRAEHARMLAHAAARRLRAFGEDRAYWLTGAPRALAEAARIRAAGFAPLP